MKLRPYQTEAIESIEKHLSDGKSTLLVMATGTGKTIVFSHLAKTQTKRTIIIAHRKELIDQAAAKIHAVTGVMPEIEMAESYSDESGFFGSSIVVASMQSLISARGDGTRMDRFRPVDFGLVVIDEAHHSASNSYRKIVEYFTANSSCKVLGVTATPDRGDKLRLGDIFHTVAMDYGILPAIKDGWLVPINQKIVELESLSLDGVTTRGGDFVDADLASRMDNEKVMRGVITPAISICEGKQTVVFAPSVDIAERMAVMWNEAKPGSAQCISGKTAKEDRVKMLSDFATRKIQVLTSCMVLTEGWDCPQVEAIVMARITKSRSYYAQVLGRGTRPLPGVVDSAEDRVGAIAASAKKELLVLDFVGNSANHKLICSIDLLAGKKPDAVIALAKKRALVGGNTLAMLEEAEDLEKEIQIKKAAKKAAANIKSQNIIATATWKTRSVDPFSFMGTRPYVEHVHSGDKPISEKMKLILAKNGMNPMIYSYAAAGQICGEIIRRMKYNLCSVKQAHYLKLYGMPTEVSRERAGELLSQKWGKRNVVRQQ